MNIIITRVFKGSLAERYGLRISDVIEKINDIQPNNVEDAIKIIKNSDKSIPLEMNIVRDKEQLKIIIDFKEKEDKIGVDFFDTDSLSYQDLKKEYDKLVDSEIKETELQSAERLEEWKNKYIGKSVKWKGWVSGVTKTTLGYNVDIDISSPSTVIFPLPPIDLVLESSEKSKAINLKKNQYIEFQGQIMEIKSPDILTMNMLVIVLTGVVFV